MTAIGPLGGLPTACSLTPGAGREQLERWRAFDDAYLLRTVRAEHRIVVHYARTDEAVQHLHGLVAVESTCCSFVDWTVEHGDLELRLVITGATEQLAALAVGCSMESASTCDPPLHGVERRLR